jgi:hypothetical protein
VLKRDEAQRIAGRLCQFALGLIVPQLFGKVGEEDWGRELLKSHSPHRASLHSEQTFNPDDKSYRKQVPITKALQGR